MGGPEGRTCGEFMPRLRMNPTQQALFDELADYAEGARMINAPQLAKFWGRDVRCIREWLQEQRLARYALGNGYGYMIRDVAKAMASCREESDTPSLHIAG